MGSKAIVASNIELLAQQVAERARPGDHILCMSNGGFGGIHTKLLTLLQNT